MTDIVIVLDIDLKVYTSSQNKSECIHHVKRQENTLKPLMLSQLFEQIYTQKIYPHLAQKQSLTLSYILGKKAGFSDARIIWVWLQSQKLFNPQTTILFYEDIEIKEEIREGHLYVNDTQYHTHKSTYTINPTSFIYLRDPSIGKKV